MKLRLMHHQEHHQGHINTIHDVVCHPPDGCHAVQVREIFSRTGQGRVLSPHTLHSRALEHKVLLITLFAKARQMLEWVVKLPQTQPPPAQNRGLSARIDIKQDFLPNRGLCVPWKYTSTESCCPCLASGL